MPREITSHKVNGCNEALEVKATDEPGSGGANHRYWIGVPHIHPVEHHVQENVRRSKTQHDIRFQNGPLKEAGVNGITHEALTAVLIDRLEAFQRGPFASPDNEEALRYYRMAMAALKSRTEKRLARGVEGSHTV